MKGSTQWIAFLVWPGRNAMARQIDKYLGPYLHNLVFQKKGAPLITYASDESRAIYYFEKDEKPFIYAPYDQHGDKYRDPKNLWASPRPDSSLTVTYSIRDDVLSRRPSKSGLSGVSPTPLNSSFEKQNLITRDDLDGHHIQGLQEVDENELKEQ